MKYMEILLWQLRSRVPAVVASLPAFPSANRLYLLTQADSTNQIGPGLVFHNGTYWESLSDNVHDLGDIESAVTLAASYGGLRRMTWSEDPTITIPDPPAAGAGFVLEINNAGGYTPTWVASINGDMETVTTGTVQLLFSATDNGASWEVTVLSEVTA